jgi:hypothetical protein
MKLVICKSNYADEFDTEGFAVWTDEEWKEFQANTTFPSYVYIGTNEEIQFDSLEEWKRCFTAKTITDEEAKRFNKLFGNEPFGMFLEWDGDDWDDNVDDY